MRAVIQRVKEAYVEVEGKTVGRIGRGLLIFLGIHRNDTETDVPWMIDKIVNLRIFEKEDGKFNESLLDIDGGLLIVSQFTLYGDCSKGRRPSFSEAMESTRARAIFEIFIDKAKEKVPHVKSGIFQTLMNVSLVNEGPVTVILDSRKEV